MTAKRRLLAVERQQRILERVAAEGALEYQQLAEELGVSIMTVRRDLKELVDQGFVNVSRGGVSAYLTRSLDMLENPRTHERADEKIQIGAAAARLLRPGEVVFLGGGSTTGAMLQFLDPDAGFQVITASLPHASWLATRGIEVICIGGSVIRQELTATGTMAVGALELFEATTAVLGGYGIARGVGATEQRMGLAEVGRAMVARSDRAIMLLDQTKVGRTGAHRIARLAELDLILTSEAGLASMRREAGGEVQVEAASDTSARASVTLET
jgi:DeoR/GlpR family transcriptional regulator of sugar metabolism